MLWERGEKSADGVKTKPKSARNDCVLPLACGEAAVLTACSASGKNEAEQAAWGHLREPGPKTRGLPSALDLASEKALAAMVRNIMGSFSA